MAFSSGKGTPWSVWRPVKKITFDKTGTLTYGTLQVEALVSCLPELPWRTLYAYAASAELHSEHPLGKSIVHSYKEEIKETPASPQEFAMLPGRGVEAVTDGKRILAGNAELFTERGIPLGEEMRNRAELFLNRGCTIIYLAVNEKNAGFIALSDTLREDAADTIDAVKSAGVTPVLLTGDHENAAGISLTSFISARYMQAVFPRTN